MKYEFWFVVGSQFLYGPEVLETVAARAAEMAAELSRALPFPLVCKVTAKTAKEISDVVKEANYDDACAGGVIAGYWKDAPVQKRLGDWMRAAVGAAVSRTMKVMRFGDNMREVAVTGGDKVEAASQHLLARGEGDGGTERVEFSLTLADL